MDMPDFDSSAAEPPTSSKNAVHDDKKGPNARNVMLGPPDRWMYCPKIGKVVVDKFVPFKTPLCNMYDNQIEKRLQFHPQDVFDAIKDRKIGLWIDLTKTDRFYHTVEVERNGAKYRKLKMAGHKQSPTKEEVDQFIRLVNGFIEEHPDKLIAVHCTHGFNRTGFCIVSFMVERMDWDVSAAIRVFAGSRPCGIYKQDYILDLFKLYDPEEDPLEAPEKPQWEYGEESMNVGEGANGVTSNGSADQAPGTSKAGKPIKLFADGKMPEVKIVTDESLKKQLKTRIRELCKYKRDGFPGSQPVSMERSRERDNLRFLTERRYRVSWKADGMRYLIYILDEGEIYAFDRDNEVFLLPRLTFPHLTAGRHIRNTLVDSELIFDVQPDGHEMPRILIYDIITFETINLAKENFDNRMACMKKEIQGARDKAASEGKVHKERELCSVRVKDFWPIETTRKILDKKFTSNVGHEIDGLIYQPVDEPYIAGRCDSVLKWKPPSHNSVDFKLQIRKEVKEGELPRYVGYLYVQNFTPPIDTMRATKKLQPYDGKIIECRRENNEWVFMRERTDKSLPNSYNTAMAVCNSMKYPIDEKVLFEAIEGHGYRGPPQKMRIPEPPAPKPQKPQNGRPRGNGRPPAKRGRKEEEEKHTSNNDEDDDYDEQL